MLGVGHVCLGTSAQLPMAQEGEMTFTTRTHARTHIGVLRCYPTPASPTTLQDVVHRSLVPVVVSSKRGMAGVGDRSVGRADAE